LEYLDIYLQEKADETILNNKIIYQNIIMNHCEIIINLERELNLKTVELLAL
jgi:hypothetical protein